MLIALAVCGHLAQAVQILAFEADDAERIDIAEFALTHDQSCARYFHRIIKGALPASEGFENPARFLAAAAAELGDGDGSIEPFDDLTRMSAQQALVGSRESVLGQMADHFEKG